MLMGERLAVAVATMVAPTLVVAETCTVNTRDVKHVSRRIKYLLSCIGTMKGLGNTAFCQLAEDVTVPVKRVRGQMRGSNVVYCSRVIWENQGQSTRGGGPIHVYKDGYIEGCTFAQDPSNFFVSQTGTIVGCPGPVTNYHWQVAFDRSGLVVATCGYPPAVGLERPVISVSPRCAAVTDSFAADFRSCSANIALERPCGSGLMGNHTPPTNRASALTKSHWLRVILLTSSTARLQQQLRRLQFVYREFCARFVIPNGSSFSKARSFAFTTCGRLFESFAHVRLVLTVRRHKMENPFRATIHLVAVTGVLSSATAFRANAQIDPSAILGSVIQQLQTGTPNPAWYGMQLWQAIRIQTNNTGVYPQLIQLGPVTGINVVQQIPLPFGAAYAMTVQHQNGLSSWQMAISLQSNKIEYLTMNPGSPTPQPLPSPSPSPPPAPGPGPAPNPVSGPSPSPACQKFPNLCP